MPDPIMEAKALISNIQQARPEPMEKSRLLYVNQLEHKKVQDRKLTWMFRNPDYGLSPLVSEMQNSPVVEQGTYRQYEAGPIVTRHMKRFTSEELMNLVSPDSRYRISAKEHIVQELLDSERRIWDTMEFMAHKAIVDGEIKYILNDAIGRMNVNVSFPIPAIDETAGGTYGESGVTHAAWNTAADTDIPSMVHDLIQVYVARYGRRPAKMRMTSRVWDIIKVNTKVTGAFSSYIRVIGLGGNAVPRGVITKELVAQALDWPPIEIYDERTALRFSAVNAESQGSNVTVELKEGTWGLKVGDTMLCKYVTTSGYEDWSFEAKVETVTDGVSVVLDIPTGKSLAAGDYLVTRPTFFPKNKVLFAGDDEFSSNKFILPPFGIEYSGSTISALQWYGPKMDIFQIGTEPGLMVGRRIWHEFGMLVGNPNALMSVKVSAA